MPTFAELCLRARKMGHKLTPTLMAELKMLSAVSDDELLGKARKEFVSQVASDFQVPVAMAEKRLEGIGPFRKDQQP